MGAVVIHTDMLSPYGWTARLVAEEKGVDYAVSPVERGSAAFRALSPFGKMPVLQHGELILFETLAVVHYLDRAFAGPSLQPDEVAAQAEMLSWISAFNAYYFPVLDGLIKERTVVMFGDRDTDPAALAALAEPLPRDLARVEAAVGAQDFLVGDRLTLADAFLFPLLHFAGFTPEVAQALEAAPATRAWLDRMRARPSFAATDPFGEMTVGG